MKQRFIFSLFILLLAGLACFSQEVEVVAINAPLNKILIGLRDKYKLQFSFNDQLLSQYNLSINKKCASPEAAIQSLINGLPLIYRMQGDIFMILPEKNRFFHAIICCSDKSPRPKQKNHFLFHIF